MRRRQRFSTVYDDSWTIEGDSSKPHIQSLRLAAVRDVDERGHSFSVILRHGPDGEAKLSTIPLQANLKCEDIAAGPEFWAILATDIAEGQTLLANIFEEARRQVTFVHDLRKWMGRGLSPRGPRKVSPEPDVKPLEAAPGPRTAVEKSLAEAGERAEENHENGLLVCWRYPVLRREEKHIVETLAVSRTFYPYEMGRPIRVEEHSEKRTGRIFRKALSSETGDILVEDDEITSYRLKG